MSEDWKTELFGIVLAGLRSHSPRRARREVWNAIYAAHNGRPDGYLVTNANQSLFRLYRNNISPNPDHLIDAAFDSQETETAT